MTDSDKFLWDLAWKHFHYHAEQRLRVFNFFIVVVTFILAGVFAAQGDNYDDFLGRIAGVGLFFMSWIFYGLDQRNSRLVKLSEETLVDFESKYPCSNAPQKSRIVLFSSADERMSRNKASVGLSYSESFRAFYMLSASIGLLIFIMSFVPGLAVL